MKRTGVTIASGEYSNRNSTETQYTSPESWISTILVTLSVARLNCWLALLQDQKCKNKYYEGDYTKWSREGFNLPEKEEERESSAEPLERNDEELDSAIEAFERLREHRIVELARTDRREKALHGGAAEKERRLSAIARRWENGFSLSVDNVILIWGLFCLFPSGSSSRTG